VKLQVVGFKRKQGVGQKSGQPFDMGICQVVFTAGDGSVTVGELVLPKGHQDVKEGVYEAQLDLARAADGRVGGRVVALVPVK